MEWQYLLLPYPMQQLLNQSEIGLKKTSQKWNEKCPFCAEIIKQEALVCPNCLKELNLPKTIEITDLPITIEKLICRFGLKIILPNPSTIIIKDGFNLFQFIKFYKQENKSQCCIK